MSTKTSKYPQVIKLPIQTFKLSFLPNEPNLKKIVLQFDVKENEGQLRFELVAYPAYKHKGKWEIGKKINMPVDNTQESIELDLPITLGNVDLNFKEISRWMNKGVKKLSFTPKKYKPNPHAEYLVTDETGSFQTLAKPSPPAAPEY